jgi:thiol:disulfide interchange protein DsbA
MRSHFARFDIQIVTFVFACLLTSISSAQTFDPTGKYDLIKPAQPTETEGKIEIIDVFWYGCPHCYQFMPTMEAYEINKPDYVEVRRMPAIFRPLWELHARAFYTADLLGVTDKLHRPIFEAMHKQKRQLDTREALIKFFGEHGVSQTDFEKTYDSFAVESLIRKSHVMQGRYGVRGTPSVIVNGKYRVSASKAGGYDGMLKVIQALVEQEQKGL